MRLGINKVVGQIYICPTIKFTYSNYLFGYKSFEFIWLKWSFVIDFIKK